jgi:nucleotide-binding universal stress UspA family protein
VSETRQRIVVGVDGSDGARTALKWALTEAARRGADVEVVTAFAFDSYWLDPFLIDRRRIDDIRSETETRARAMVEEARQDLALDGLPGGPAVGITILVAGGAPTAHLVQQSEGAALLVVGSRGRGAVRSAFAGSVALHCSAHAMCPVVVVPPAMVSAEEPPRVVVGLDDSAEARAALTAAVDQATPLGARVDVVVAYQTPDYWVDLYAVASPLPELQAQAQSQGASIVTEVLGAESLESGLVRVVTVEGSPARVLIGEAEGAQLLVVGSRSHHALEGVVLGSVALRCVMHAPCPVMVVRTTSNPASVPSPRAATDAAVTTA